MTRAMLPGPKGLRPATVEEELNCSAFIVYVGKKVVITCPHCGATPKLGHPSRSCYYCQTLREGEKP